MNRVLCSLAGIIVAITSAGADPPAPKPTLCDVATNPDRFNGTMVTVRSRVQIAFEDFELSAAECPGHKIDSIWLEYGRGPAKQPAIWCCGDTTPRDSQIALNQDLHFRRFHHYLTAQRRTKGCHEGECYLYTVTATLTGRFDMASSRVFGHLGQFPARLVIQSVSDVSAEPVSHPAVLH